MSHLSGQWGLGNSARKDGWCPAAQGGVSRAFIRRVVAYVGNVLCSLGHLNTWFLVDGCLWRFRRGDLVGGILSLELGFEST